MRQVMVRVLPVPAPASTHSGPRGASTASRCSSSRLSSRALATGMVPIMAGDADNSGAGIAVGWGLVRSGDDGAAHHVHHKGVWLLLSAQDGVEVGGGIGRAAG